MMENLRAYIPIDRRPQLETSEDLPTFSEGVVLCADISGLTKLTYTLGHELSAQRCAESLTNHLNRIYGALIQEVHYYGGSIINFSGDTMTCWFARKQDNSQTSFLATACALAMQKAMASFSNITTPKGKLITLGIRIGVTTGEAQRLLVGHTHIQKIDTLAGRPLVRSNMIKQGLTLGEVGIDIATANHLQGDVQIAQWQELKQGERFAIVTGLNRVITPHPWTSLTSNNTGNIREWILHPIYEQVLQGQEILLAEFRRCAVLLLKFSGIDYETDSHASNKLNAYIQWAQKIITYYDGFFLHLMNSDQGQYFCAVFGAPIAHENYTNRALKAAWELQQTPIELNYIQSTQIGISHGAIYAGAFGSSERRTYSILGNEINIASHLMNVATHRQILVTEQIVQASKQYRFAYLGTINFKEINQPLPVSVVVAPQNQVIQTNGTPFPLVGRESEITILQHQLQALEQREPNIVVIEANAGMGKSCLVTKLQEKAKDFTIRLLIGWGNAIEKNTPYHAWRPIFAQLFGIDLLADLPETQHTIIRNQLADLPELLHLLPLLNAVLPLDLPDNQITKTLQGTGRAHKTNDFLLQVLQHQLAKTPLLLILEDAHWLDLASWTLARLVQFDIEGLLLVIVTRPMTKSVPKGYQDLLTRHGLFHLQLGNLTSEEIHSLVCTRLQVSELPDTVLTFIQEQTKGHPFLSEELAYALRDKKLIQIENGKCSPTTNDLHLDFPDTIEGVVTNRIKHLDSAQQLTLKVASVVGQVFATRILQANHPMKMDKSHLDILEQLDIPPLITPLPELTYIFKHIASQETTDILMPATQQEQLHGAVAKWYERVYANELGANYPLLAYHWQKAGILSKALYYLDNAGKQAMRRGTYHAAIGFYKQLLLLESEVETTSTVLQQSEWLFQLGDAYYRVGKMAESFETLTQVVSLLGYPYPQSNSALIWQVIKQAYRQFWHRIRPKTVNQTNTELIQPHWLASRTYHPLLMMEVLFQEHHLQVLYASLSLLNLAELAGNIAQTEQVKGYATQALSMSVIGFGRLASMYANLTKVAAEQTTDLDAKSYALSILGVYASGCGAFQKAQTYFQESSDLAQQAGNIRQWEESIVNLANTYNFQGYWDKAALLYNELYISAIRQEDVEAKSWALTNQAYIALRHGELDKAIDLVEQSGSQSLWCLGILTLSYLYKEDFDTAEKYAKKIANMVTKSRPNAYFFSLAYVGLAEFYLSRWETTGNNAYASLAKSALTYLQQFAKAFQIGTAYYTMYQSWYAYLQNKTPKAESLGQQAIKQAKNLNIPYNEGLAYYHLGRFTNSTMYLSQAETIFARLGAKWDLAQTHRHLSEKTTI